MAEPSSTTAAVITATGLSMATLVPGMDGNALIGAFAGAALFVISAKEIGQLRRFAYLLISVVMGYMSAPDITALTFIDETGVAGFVGGLLCVTAALLFLERLERFDFLNLIKGLWK